MKSKKAITKCAEWLKSCLDSGWGKENLKALEKLWWKFHDHKTGEVVRVKKLTVKLTNKKPKK